MGVPKFFRYISERYPCLSELVKEYQIPEFDNLYLDMNGIIHMCSHPDDNNPHFRITEEKIFKDIFHYIEVLFRMIRPQKLFFMAVDGVAPRAKMNQQRGRRFRSAKDAEKQESDAVKKGEVLPDQARFDSNCITPGTVFMARLHEQLKYFVVNKISNDPTWQKCKVILSGHETPGEGEHKIMDYIRYMRAQPGYDPNTRHCLYGLDADLIMLGLCTHEPHFSLLREEVKFGKKSTKRASVPEEITFYLLHLSLMREYLELEFTPLKNKLPGFQFDLEKIIDDWVLMGFLVGNDFIPHLPNLHIANGALPILYKAYMDILPTLDGYINEAGTLNLTRFEKFMEKLGSIDLENFEEIREDLLYMESKTGRKLNAHSKVSSKNLEEWTPDDQEVVPLEPLEPEKPKDSGMLALINQTNDLLLDSEEEETEQSEEDDAFETYKRDYYMNKLEYANVTPEVMRDQAEGYVRAIQWNLNYYYNGCCSWSWYYPHHYAPYISDIKGFSNLKIEFDMGKPFLPYEQLLAVLPAASKNLLPECYHRLMTDENSQIKRYYPEEFQTDLNGKKQEWEAVVLVPFIDETVLLKAMQECNDELTPEEKKRNSHGPMLVYTYTPKNKGPYPAPEYFLSVPQNHAEISTLNYDDVLLPKEKLVKGAYPGVKMDVYYPGFPTMKHLNYKAQLKKAKIKVFESPSRNENMIITIINNKFPGDKIPVDLLGTTVWVGWPHLVEAKVVSISNNKRKYISMGAPSAYNVEERTESLVKQFDQEVDGITEFYQKRMGIEVGQTKVLVHVQVMTGRKYVFSPNGRITLEKVFTPNIANYPLQTIVYDISSYDSYHSTFRDIHEVFPVGCTCFTLTNPYYGAQGIVQDSKESLKNGRVKISITVIEEPDLSSVREMRGVVERSYKTLYHAASQLSISNFLFSRVTGSIFISARNGEGGLKNVNVGLDLKFNKKNKETPGYTKKIENTWLYTDKAVELVRQYMEKYPEVFDYLSHDDRFDEIDVESIFKDDWEEKLKELQNWLKSLPSYSIERQVCGAAALEIEEVEQIEKIVDESQKTVSGKRATMQIKPNFLYRSEIQNGTLPPDPKATTRILDRIINVRSGFSVPLGLKGTVISIQESTTDSDRDTMYDVVFDKPFPDGMKLNCSEGRGYRLPKSAFINISYGQRLMIEKTGRPDELIANAKSSQRNNLNPPQQQQRPWFPSQPFVPVQAPFQKENSAFAQFNATAPNKPFSNPPYAQAKNFAEFSGPGNKPPRQPQENYSPQRQQKYQNGNGDAPNRRTGPNYQRNNDFMPNFGGKATNLKPKEARVLGQPHLQKSLPPQTSPIKQQQNVRATVNTDILKTILKIGQDNKEKVKTGASTVGNSYQNSPSTSHTATKEKENNQNTLFDMFAEAAKAPATIRLLTYYQSNGLGLPRYQYFNRGNLVQSQITLSNGEFVVGKPATTREEASENVAADVLNIFLKGRKTEAAPAQASTSHLETKDQAANNANRQEIKNPANGNGQKAESTSRSGPKSTVLNNSFVPLQAIKSQINKNNVSSNKNMAGEAVTKGNESEKQDNREISTRNNRYNSKGHNSRNHPNRSQRKTRIAANFDLLKNTSGPPEP